MYDNKRREIQDRSIELMDKVEFFRSQNKMMEVGELLSRIAELGSTIALNYNELDDNTIDKVYSLLKFSDSIFNGNISKEMINSLENLTTSIELLLQSKKILLRSGKREKQVA